MILADKITEERKKNGWSQEELAEKLGVSRQAVSKWESAGTIPDLQRVLQLAELFGDKGIIGLSQMTCGYAAGHMGLVLFISGEEKDGAEQFNTSIFHKPDCLIAQ